MKLERSKAARGGSGINIEALSLHSSIIRAWKDAAVNLLL